MEAVNVARHIVQLLLDLDYSAESQDPTAPARPKPSRSKSRAPRKVVLADITEEDLNLPLFAESDFVYDASHEVMPSTHESEVQVDKAQEAAESEQEIATEEALGLEEPTSFLELTLEVFTKLHAGLLWRQMELLLWSKEVGGKARKEILDWVFAPLEHTDSRSGAVKTIRGIDMPFSFELCCYVEEVNAEAIKHAIATRLQHIKQGAGHRIRGRLH